MEKKDTVTFEIVDHIGVIQEYPNGWRKELNKVSWNGNPPKFDIREWDPNHERMSRGVTLSLREMDQIRGLMNAHDGRTNLMPREQSDKEYER